MNQLQLTHEFDRIANIKLGDLVQVNDGYDGCQFKLYGPPYDNDRDVLSGPDVDVDGNILLIVVGFQYTKGLSYSPAVLLFASDAVFGWRWCEDIINLCEM
jgi:hypothetical protein